MRVALTLRIFVVLKGEACTQELPEVAFSLALPGALSTTFQLSA